MSKNLKIIKILVKKIPTYWLVGIFVFFTSFKCLRPYLVILFNDYRDFKGANKNDNFNNDIVVRYNKDTNKITKYYYTELDN